MNVNGTIQVITRTADAINPSTGDPVPATELAGPEIQCHIKAINQSNKGIYEGGTFSQSTYEILIEARDIEGNRLRIKNNKGNDLGDFTIQSIEHLDITNRTKITV